MKFIYLLIIPFAIFIFSCSKDEINPLPKTESKHDTLKSIVQDTVIITGTGDIMMGTTYPSSDLPPDDGKYLFEEVKEILSASDLTIGNLEGPFLNSGGTPKQCETPDRCYSFRVSERYAAYLKDAGFDYMNLANNHAYDMGKQGRETTYRVLEENDITFAGTDDYPTATCEVKGIRVGFTGFAPNRGTLSINKTENAKDIIKELKSRCDIVVVMFHGGAEGAGAQNVPKKDEIFLGENRGNVYKFAHLAIDAGADIVLGHGPHVTRAVEIYNGKFIAYSLGNFCTYGKFSLAGVQGIAPIIKVYLTKKAKFIKAEVISIKQVRRGFPVIDDKQAALMNIVKLTKEDFGNESVTFKGNLITNE